MTTTDALVIGAGPVGLYQAFQLGLLGLSVQIIDALPHLGGQCAELYPDKPIYDIPAIPVCTGLELVERLQQQLRPFNPAVHLNQLVSAITRTPDGGWQVDTDLGLQAHAKVLVIAAGVGAFVPKRLKIPGAEAFTGRQLFYRLDDPASHAHQDVVVLGGDALALDWILRLAALPAAQQPRNLCLMHRREVLTASAEQLDAFNALRAAGRVRLVVGQPGQLVADATNASHAMKQLDCTAPDGSSQQLDATVLLAATGLSPRLGPIADWGLAMDRKQLSVDPASCETSEKGLFAVGDINHYPGKKKLIACGFHEAIMAAYAAAEVVAPGQTGPLQYTTSSALLQRRLGVLPG